MEELEIREDIRKKLNAIHRVMTKQESGDKSAFLQSKLDVWEQKIQNDNLMFKTLLTKGELNADPETFQVELDEEKWALGVLQLWIYELEAEFDNKASDLSETDPIINVDTIKEISLIETYDGYWNVKQVAKYLNLGVDYIYQLSSKGEIPKYKRGSRILFKRDDIDNWLLEKKE
jgi:excisionase family DNA binding protein